MVDVERTIPDGSLLELLETARTCNVHVKGLDAWAGKVQESEARFFAAAGDSDYFWY